MRPLIPTYVLHIALIFLSNTWFSGLLSAQNDIDTVHVRICPGHVDCAFVSAPDSFTTYEWSTGSTAQTVELCTQGWYTYTVTDENGATEVGAVYVHDSPPVMRTINLSYCAGDDFIEGWDYPPTVGIFTDTIADPVTGCPDTILDVIITEKPLETAAISLYTCLEDYPSFTYTDTISSIDPDGCDTIYTITVTQTALYPIQADTVVCGDDAFPVLFRGVLFDAPGVETDTMYASLSDHCDTLLELEVVVEPNIELPSVMTDGGTGTGSIAFDDTTVTYLWPDGGADLSRTSLSRGHYPVTITDHNGCSRVYEVFVPGPLDDNPVGSDDLPEIYPNPTNDDITIDFPADAPAQDHQVIITDIHGRIVPVQSYTSASTMQIDLNGPPGVYILSIIRAGTYIAVRRIIRTQ